MRQQLGTLAWLHAVFFIDENRGWSVGSKGTLLATVDGGKTWQLQPLPTRDALRDVYFADNQHGWLLCEANLYELKRKEDPRTYLLQTTDGGANWKRVVMRNNDADARLVRAVFGKHGRVWAFGEEGIIFTTRDSGVSWTRLEAPTRHLLLGGTFIDDNRGWIVGAGATIIQTSDGGDSWHMPRVGEARQSGVRFAATSFVDHRSGWAVGSGGNIYRTQNGGRTWHQQESGVTADLYDVKFLSALEGWAVGAEGVIIHTTDAGLHWAAEQSGTEHPLERIFFIDRGHGWAVGFGGTVLRYSHTESHASN